MCAFLIVVTDLGKKSCSFHKEKSKAEHAGKDNINKLQTPGAG